MEDSHTHILNLPDDNKDAKDNKPTAWFSVYDGHGGAVVAKHASMYLHKFIVRRPEFPEDIPEALRQGFIEYDSAMYHKEKMAGSTAVTVLIRDNKLYCANAGDSRGIASRKGQLIALSNDHKPNNPEEMERIYNAGGWVEFNRVNGNLALSRALGDYLFKRNETFPPEKQIVTALPEVKTFDIDEDWEFMVLACDGIWDVLTNQAVLNFVTEMIGEGKYPEEICEELLTYCLAPVCQMGGLGGDNMTIIIICFLHGKPWETLVEKCKKNHADKKASTKLSGSAFTQFDRLSSDGPFSDVAILKASDENQIAESGSSSSHTSSPSSSPVSGDEKFEKFEAIVDSTIENLDEKEGAMKVDEPEQGGQLEKVQAVPAKLDDGESSNNIEPETANVADEKNDEEKAREKQEKDVEETTQKSKEIKLSENESPPRPENNNKTSTTPKENVSNE